jgi:hypothetical protein
MSVGMECSDMESQGPAQQASLLLKSILFLQTWSDWVEDGHLRTAELGLRLCAWPFTGAGDSWRHKRLRFDGQGAKCCLSCCVRVGPLLQVYKDLVVCACLL